MGSGIEGLATGKGERPLALTPLTKDGLKRWLKSAAAAERRWVEASGFTAEAGSFCLLPAAASGRHQGAPSGALAGVAALDDLWSYAALARALPAGTWRLAEEPAARAAERLALGWALGGYTFDRYRGKESGARGGAKLLWPRQADRPAVRRLAEAIALVRDLINTPANELGPAELVAAGRALAANKGARARVLVGEALLRQGFPTVHAVGRASARPPCLLDLTWGKKGPLVAVVGKGVCFDSGGLDLKTAEGMRLMKKDMGGAAHAIALAKLVIESGLLLRLRLLVPAVENAVAGNALRPLDVIRTRKGLTVEVGNTDAEGRLILSDALAAAGEDKPDLIIDFATLTGAARVALGPELPAMFSNHEPTAAALLRHGEAEGDPLWRLPLYQPYGRWIAGKAADLNNIANNSFAGALVAALFLERFVPSGTPWVHLDIGAWNMSDALGRREGGEAMGLRAAFALIAELAGQARGHR